MDGVNYFFMTEPEFWPKKRPVSFSETADVFGLAHYGTPVKPIVEHLEPVSPWSWKSTYKGAPDGQTGAQGTRPRSAYRVPFEPPSFEELKRRLIGRGTETPSAAGQRLETAKVEVGRCAGIDKRIVNNGRRWPQTDELWHITPKICSACNPSIRLSSQ